MKDRLFNGCRGKVFGLAMWQVIALLAMLGLVDSGKAAVGAGFCKSELVVRNYLAPLSKLPKENGFKPSGKLGIGPPALRIFPPRSELIVLNKDSFEVRGHLEGNPHPSKRLDWRAVSRLERISRKGLVQRLVKERQLYLPTIASFDDRQLGFGAAVREGLYRLSIEFQNRRGKTLNRYREYFRAVRPRSDIRLAISSSQIPAGQIAQYRLKNFGSVDASFNYYVQLLNSNAEEVPVEQGVFPTLRPVIRAGHASECVSFTIPADIPPGQYVLRVQAWDRVLQQPKVLQSSIEIQSP